MKLFDDLKSEGSSVKSSEKKENWLSNFQGRILRHVVPLKSPPDFAKLARGNKKIYHVTGSNIRVYFVLASSAIAICFIFLSFVLERIDFRCSNGLGRFCPGAIFFAQARIS